MTLSYSVLLCDNSSQYYLVTFQYLLVVVFCFLVVSKEDVIILVSYVLSVTCLCFIYVTCRSGDHVITNIQVSSCWRFSLLIANSVAAGII